MADETTLRTYLTAAGTAHEIIEVQGTARTAREAARALGAPLDAIVKSLLCLADGQPVLALIPGDRTLAPDKLARRAGATIVTLASGRIVATCTGYPVGGVAPLAHAQPLPVYADARIREHDEVFCGAGSVKHMVRIAPNDLGRLASALWADLSK